MQPRPQRLPAPASTFKPATLIESPIEWDGSGLLPGESLSKHRGRQNESVPEEQAEPVESVVKSASEHQIISSDLSAAITPAPDVTEEEEFFEETTEPEPSELPPGASFDAGYETSEEELVPEPAEDHLVEEEMVEEEWAPDADVQANRKTARAEVEPLQAQPEPRVGAPAKPEDYTIEPVINEPSAEEQVAPPMTRQDEVLPEGAHAEPAGWQSVAFGTA